MSKKRTWSAVLAAFFVTLSVLLLIGGLLLVNVRNGRILFGEQYEAVSRQQAEPITELKTADFVWLPARFQVLLRIPYWELHVWEWLES